MGLMLLINKIVLLFLLISAALLSTSSFAAAGRHSRLAGNFQKEGRRADHQEVQQKHLREEEVVEIHERILKVNTKDYGRYDPAPALGKPPFKLIPN